MPSNQALLPKAKLLDSQVNLAATATKSFTLDMADSYRFILDIPAGVGTSPTLDLVLEHSPDGGTTWYGFAKIAQVTGTAIVKQLDVKRRLGYGEAAANVTVQSAVSGAAYVQNGPIYVQNCRINYVVGGTSPQFTGTLKVWVVENSLSEFGV